ncbi:hypothetical protein EP47_04365 [Legionella norrlandica]|uniref:Transmembrane protein n=1 Tax=Legionella norrlandica TaxID=1498499 RepID=A0A0A2SNI3_9GAMM|nr:hypothetical protein [Legionella norrlandica]KGP62710.1 hypothetical protein EP47_04365 [Legionella norrlandica]
MRDNLSTPVSISISALPGTIGSVISGVGVGISQAGRASSKAIQESNLAQRDSLLKALDLLFKAEDPEENAAALDLFPEALRDMLRLTRNGVASIVNKIVLTPATAASHLSQLPLDVTAVISGLAHSVNDYHQFLQTERASTLDVKKELEEHKSGFSANCRALCDNCNGILDELRRQINPKFKAPGSGAGTHARIAKSMASSAAIGSLSTAGLVSVMVDLIGSSFREVSALVEFSKQESIHPQEKNVYQAFRECCQSFSNGKDLNESFAALRRLEEAIFNFDQASKMTDKHSVSSPVASVLVRLLTAEPFVKTLIATNASFLGLTEAQHALEQQEENCIQNTDGAAAKASLIKDFSGGDAVHHSQNVSVFCDQFDEMINHIDQHLGLDDQHLIIASSATSTVRGSSALVIAASLIPGFTGLISRELSGSVNFTKNDKGSKAESAVVLQTRKEMTGADLDALMSRVCALQERIVRCNQLGVSAPVVLGVSELITSGSLIASLNVIAGMLSALRELRTVAESPSIPLKLKEEEQRKAAEYVDSVIKSNKGSANALGTGAVSDNLSLLQHLASAMEKVVLIHRSHQNFLEINGERKDINSVGKASVAFSQGNSTGFLIGAFGVLALIALESGIGLEALFGALRFSTEAKRLSGGVDRIESDNGFKTNLSLVSNATRLTEDSLKSASILQSTSKTTYLGVESIALRSFVVALCQSGALKEMLRRLIQEEQERLELAPGFSNSALLSDALMPRLYDNILRVLDEAEANHNPIPNLNRDMASSLSTVSNSSIAAVLSAHSVFISPILKAIAAAKKASIIGNEQKNEAVSANSEISGIISTALNVIQAFTKNFKHEIKRMDNPIENSSIVHQSEEANVTLMVSCCAMSLLCEELFELCMSRSLTLLDKEKIEKTAQKSNEQTHKESDLLSNAVKEDSGVGEENNMLHMISALRLTISRLGVALGDFASEMEVNPDLLRDNIELHSSQQRLIQSMASFCSRLSAIMLSFSGGLSNLPASSAGSIDALRECIHSIDHQLALEPVHSSEHSTKDCGSGSLLITGISTDCVSSILCSATKLLLQASVLGLDSTLSVAKIMEILCLHPRPLQGLTMEAQGSSQPNGLSNNLNKQTQNAIVASSVNSASIVLTTKTGQSESTDNLMHVFQAAVDQRIDEIALLEDEEEDSALGLKAFYEQIVRILYLRNVDDENCKDLILRFHRGGITLSSYHSAHGGILNSERSKRTSNRLISEYGFCKCDDAASLLEVFINRAVNNERTSFSILNKLKEGLVGHPLSDKVQAHWQYIVNRVIDRLTMENMRISLFNPGDARRNQKKWEERRLDLLNNWEKQKSEEPNPSLEIV